MPVSPKAMSEPRKTSHHIEGKAHGVRIKISLANGERRLRLTSVDENKSVRRIGRVGNDERATSLTHMEARVGLG